MVCLVHSVLRTYSDFVAATAAEPLGVESVPKDLRDNATGLLSATRFEQIRVFNDWLVPVMKKSLLRFAVYNSPFRNIANICPVK